MPLSRACKNSEVNSANPRKNPRSDWTGFLKSPGSVASLRKAFTPKERWLLEPFLQPLVGAIGPHFRNPGQLPSQRGQQQLGPFLVMAVRRRHPGLDDQTRGVHQQVVLATLYFLAPVVAPRPPFSVVFTDWLSMTPALGVGSRPTLSRSFSRKTVFILSSTPSLRQTQK